MRCLTPRLGRRRPGADNKPNTNQRLRANDPDTASRAGRMPPASGGGGRDPRLAEVLGEVVVHEALGLGEVAFVAGRVALERAADERVAELDRHAEAEAELGRIDLVAAQVELGLDEPRHAVRELGLDVAVGGLASTGVHDA